MRGLAFVLIISASAVVTACPAQVHGAFEITAAQVVGPVAEADLDCATGYSGIAKVGTLECTGSGMYTGQAIGCGQCPPYYQGGYRTVNPTVMEHGTAIATGAFATEFDCDPLLWYSLSAGGIVSLDGQALTCMNGTYTTSLGGCDVGCPHPLKRWGTLYRGLQIDSGTRDDTTLYSVNDVGLPLTTMVRSKPILCAPGYTASATTTSATLALNCVANNRGLGQWTPSEDMSTFCTPADPSASYWDYCAPFASVMPVGYAAVDVDGVTAVRAAPGGRIKASDFTCAADYALSGTAVSGYVECVAGRWKTQLYGCVIPSATCKASTRKVAGFVLGGTAPYSPTGCGPGYSRNVDPLKGEMECVKGVYVVTVPYKGCVRSECSAAELIDLLDYPYVVPGTSTETVAFEDTANDLVTDVISCASAHPGTVSGQIDVVCTRNGWRLYKMVGSVREPALSGCSIAPTLVPPPVSSGSYCDPSDLSAPAGYVVGKDAATGLLSSVVCDEGAGYFASGTLMYPSCVWDVALGLQWDSTATWSGCKQFVCPDGDSFVHCVNRDTCSPRSGYVCKEIIAHAFCCHKANPEDAHFVMLRLADADAGALTGYGWKSLWTGKNSFVVVNGDDDLTIERRFAFYKVDAYGAVQHDGTVAVNKFETTDTDYLGGVVAATWMGAFAGDMPYGAFTVAGGDLVATVATNRDWYGLDIGGIVVHKSVTDLYHRLPLQAGYPAGTGVSYGCIIGASRDVVVVGSKYSNAAVNYPLYEVWMRDSVTDKFVAKFFFEPSLPSSTLSDWAPSTSSVTSAVATDGSYIFVGVPLNKWSVATDTDATANIGGVAVFRMVGETIEVDYGRRDSTPRPGKNFAFLQPLITSSTTSYFFGETISVGGGRLAVGARAPVCGRGVENVAPPRDYDYDVTADAACTTGGFVVVYKRVKESWRAVEAIVRPPLSWPQSCGTTCEFAKHVQIVANDHGGTLLVTGTACSTREGFVRAGSFEFDGGMGACKDGVYVYMRQRVAQNLNVHEWNFVGVILRKELRPPVTGTDIQDDFSFGDSVSTYDGSEVVVGSVSNFAEGGVEQVLYDVANSAIGTVDNPGAAFYVNNILPPIAACYGAPPVPGGVMKEASACVAGASHGTSCGADEVVCDTSAHFCDATGSVECVNGVWVGALSCVQCLCSEEPQLPPVVAAVADTKCAGTVAGGTCHLGCRGTKCGQPAAKHVVCVATSEGGVWQTAAGQPLSTLTDPSGCKPCTAASCSLPDNTPGYFNGNAGEGYSVVCPHDGTSTCPPPNTYGALSCSAAPGPADALATCNGYACPMCSAGPWQASDLEAGGLVTWYTDHPGVASGGTHSVTAACPTPVATVDMCGTQDGVAECRVGSWVVTTKLSGCHPCKRCSVPQLRADFYQYIFTFAGDWAVHGDWQSVSLCNPTCTDNGGGPIRIDCLDGEWVWVSPPSFCTC